jgi:alpha-tubulin suppressor-like RCC1 family protein
MLERSLRICLTALSVTALGVACSSKASKEFVTADAGTGRGGGSSAGNPGMAGDSAGGDDSSGGTAGSGGSGVAGCGNLDIDPQNCGACGSICDPGENCLAGVCGGDQIVKVTAGSGACILTEAGKIFCFGPNQYGQCGVPLSGNVECGPGMWPCRQEAVEVLGISDAIDVANGLDYTCALRAGGKVFCWGRNEWGQLGHDPADDDNCGEPCQPTPSEVQGVEDAVGVAAGRWTACAWTSAGAAYCWGRNNDGVVGNGVITEMEPLARPVTDLGADVSRIVMMLGGVNHACAIMADHTVRCWGHAGYGQLGQPVSNQPIPTPMTVPGLSNVVDLALGDGASCAVTDAETVLCWGVVGNGFRNGFDYIGLPHEIAQVSGLPPILASSAYRGHVCVRSSLSDLWCWGDNRFGQLGDGTFAGGFSGDACLCKPAFQIPDLKVKLHASGNDVNIAVKFDNTVWTWGKNSAGSLGHEVGMGGDITCDSAEPCNPTPTQVMLPF